MKLKAVSVRAFELFTLDGTSLGLFLVDSEWQGMQKLKALDREVTVIVDGCGSGVDELFATVFGERRAEVNVVKASPNFLVKSSYTRCAALVDDAVGDRCVLDTGHGGPHEA